MGEKRGRARCPASFYFDMSVESARRAPRAPARWGTGRRPGGPPPRKEGFGAAAGAPLSRAFLDRHSDEGAPFGPRSVVVADSVLAKEIFQDEPRVSASLADPAVRDGLTAPVDPLLSID